MFPAMARPMFQWCNSLWISESIRDSTWIFAVLEIVHLLGMAVLLGSLVVFHVRLLGLGMRRQPVAVLARDLWPWTAGGLAVMIMTGFLMFLSEAMKCYASPPFGIKMLLLALAVPSHLIVFRHAQHLNDGSRLPLWTKPAAGISLLLWFGVGVAGRAIGFQ
jgi:hypothetical protein